MHGMSYAQYWGAIADHSGDAYFDFIYRCDWPSTLDELAKYRSAEAPPGPRRRRRETSATPRPASTTAGCSRFLEHVWKKDEAIRRRGALPHESRDGRDLRSRSAGAERLPRAVQPRDRRADSRRAGGSGCAHDPIHLVERTRENLQDAARHLHRLRLARSVPHPLRRAASCRKRLAQAGIEHRYEEFDDKHSASTTGWT